MIIKINSRSEMPIYLQLRNQIVKGIGKGELEQGEILPTVRQMAADLGVNAMTVSKAYQLLKVEGFIETDRRKGSIVCIPEKEYPTQQAAFEEKLEDELELLTAEAKIRGMDKGQFIQFCQHILRKWRWWRNDSNDHYDIDGLADGGGYEVGLQLQSGLSSGNAIWCSCAG